VKDRGVGNKNNAVIFFDFGTLWLGCHPVNTRSEEDTSLAFREFLGTTQTVKSFYSDGAPEIVAVANKMGWTNDTSTPGIPRNNSIIENKVKLVVNGGRSLLLQAGLPSKFWPFATQAFCNGLNTIALGEESRYFKRHGVEFPGKLIPFGCLVDYYPTKRTYRKSRPASGVKDKPVHDDDGDSSDEECDADDEPSRLVDEVAATSNVDKHLADEIDHGDEELPKFSPRGVPGIFLGHRFSPGGVWKGEYYVVNLADLRRGKRRPRIQRVRSIIVDDSEGHVFPMRSLYEFVQRTAMYRNTAKPALTGGHTDDSEDLPLFDADLGPASGISSGADIAESKQKDEEISFADYWEIDPEAGVYVYHHVVSHKRLFVPSKSADPGFGDFGSKAKNLAPIRVTKGVYSSNI